MQQELTALRPELVKAQQETESLMVVIEKEAAEVVEPKRKVGTALGAPWPLRMSVDCCYLLGCQSGRGRGY